MLRMLKMSSNGLWQLQISLHRQNKSRILRRPEGRLWVLMSIRLHKTSLKRLRPSCFLRCPGCRKWVCMVFQHQETSLHPLHQSRFLRRPGARLWVRRAIRLLRSSLKRLRPSRFFGCPGCRKWVRMAFGHLETSLHRLLQSLFFLRHPGGRIEFLWAIRLLKTSHTRILPSRFFNALSPEKEFAWLLTTWNIASSIEPKSFFKTSRRQIMSCLGHSPT
jgi:hypothetical protein